MNTQKLGNIPLKDFRLFLSKIGCEFIDAGRGGHEKWIKSGLTRPIIIQSHIDPVPRLVVLNTLRNLGISRKEYFDLMSKKH